jgi:hypothetical protein
MKQRALPFLALAALTALVVTALVAGCATGPGGAPVGGSERLAGGGRSSDSDAFAGGAGGSGPILPDDPNHPEPNPDFLPLFFAEIDCQANPSEKVIRDRDEWRAWWTAATACIPPWVVVTCPPPEPWDTLPPPPDPLPPPDSLPPGDSTGWRSADSGWACPDSAHVDTIYQYPFDAPEVDFDANVVIVISIEPEAAWGRAIWIQEVVSSGGGSLVRYQVSRLGDDCQEVLMRPDVPHETTPTIAVQVPRPVDEPVDWQREDIVFNCLPDPNEPIAIYYTDGDCDLGPGEVVIRDQGTFDAWIQAAIACDMARWGDPTEPPTPIEGDGGGGSVPPILPTTIGFGVDFTTHAVVILRAEAQTRWGGGVWLDHIDSSGVGSTIEYTVMEPSDGCPLVDGGEVLRPTVAVRVPLPLPDPVTWNRRVETIDCYWESDGSGGEPPPGR